MAANRGKRFLFSCATALLVLAVCFAVGEIIARATGHKPWQIVRLPVVVEPGGKFYAPHPTLGYTHIPGKFTAHIGPQYTFTATNLPDTNRITRPLEMYGPAAPRKEQLWIFGCSFTYGWSVNDDQTYPWLLQQALPDYDVANFGMDGYGTLQSLMQFREALKARPKPVTVVYAYASFHDERNTFLRIRRKYMVPYNTLGPIHQPYARLDRNGGLRIFSELADYREVPLMRRSALVNFLETYYDTDVEPKLLKSNKVSRMLIADFSRQCAANGIKFVLAGISDDGLTKAVLRDYARGGGAAIDISVNLDAPGNRNLPYDFHPAPAAHRQYAQKLLAGLQKK